MVGGPTKRDMFAVDLGGGHCAGMGGESQESRTSRRQSGTEREREAATAGGRLGSSGGTVRNRTKVDSGTDRVKCNA